MYARYPVAFVRGKGARLWDADGKAYLDFFTGLAVNNLGHAHPRIVAAIREQSEKLLHASNVYYNEPAARLGMPLDGAFLRRASLLLQQRRRGQRGGDQARSQARRRGARRPLRDPHHLRLVPRANDRDRQRDGAGEVSERLSAAAPGFPLRSIRRRGGDGGGGARGDRRDSRRADPGRRRRERPAGRISAPAARALRPRRAALDSRRSPGRHGTHGHALRPPARRDPAGHRHARQGARRRRADRRHADDGGDRPRTRHRGARLDVRRQPARLRRGDRRPAGASPGRDPRELPDDRARDFANGSTGFVPSCR